MPDPTTVKVKCSEVASGFIIINESDLPGSGYELYDENAKPAAKAPEAAGRRRVIQEAKPAAPAPDADQAE